jgi:hypothetical protein
LTQARIGIRALMSDNHYKDARNHGERPSSDASH